MNNNRIELERKAQDRVDWRMLVDSLYSSGNNKLGHNTTELMNPKIPETIIFASCKNTGSSLASLVPSASKVRLIL
ncbi:unnamed protein product [Schistosoma mattheei]|uniref:Uncharacterized protein n=1 Tax=Schistosoma mattheei TaxID=31246 RepID=A0A183NPD0_9TREM|nr:unnamed protein product [Schistosoma mattheei]